MHVPSRQKLKCDPTVSGWGTVSNGTYVVYSSAPLFSFFCRLGELPPTSYFSPSTPPCLQPWALLPINQTSFLLSIKTSTIQLKSCNWDSKPLFQLEAVLKTQSNNPTIAVNLGFEDGFLTSLVPFYLDFTPYHSCAASHCAHSQTQPTHCSYQD